MNTRTNTKEALDVLRRIRRHGKSSTTAIIFLKSFFDVQDNNSMKYANRCLAVAEIMSRLAAGEQRHAWYITGLMNGVAEARAAADPFQRSVVASLMRKAGMNSDMSYCIEQYGTMSDPRQWSDIMIALVYAESHVDNEGNILTTSDCCRERRSTGKENAMCEPCMYARYLMGKSGNEEKAETILSDLRYELHSSQDKRKRESDTESSRTTLAASGGAI